MENKKNTKEFSIKDEELDKSSASEDLIKTQVFTPKCVKEKKTHAFLDKIKAFFADVREGFFVFCERLTLSAFYMTGLFTAAIIVACMTLTLSSGIVLGLLSLIFGIIYLSGFLALGVFEIGASLAFFGFSLLLFTLFFQAARVYLPFMKNQMRERVKQAFEKKEARV